MRMSQELLTAPARKYSSLIVGRPKTGKTFCHRTFFYWLRDTNQPYKKIWLYDFDKGAESLIQVANEEGWMTDENGHLNLEVFRYSIKGGDKISTEVTPDRSMEQFNEFMKEFNFLFDQVDPRTGDWKDSFKPDAPGLIIIDSISSIQGILFDFILLMLGRGSSSNARVNEFGSFATKMTEIIDSARDLPCHCSFIAHEEPRTRSAWKPGGDDKIQAVATDGKVYTVPAIIGNLRWNLAKSFDLSLYADNTMGWKWRTQSGHDLPGIGVRTMQKLPPLIDQDFRIILKAGVITRQQTAAERIADAAKSAPAKPASSGSAIVDQNLKPSDSNLKQFQPKPAMQSPISNNTKAATEPPKGIEPSKPDAEAPKTEPPNASESTSEAKKT